MTDEPTTQEPNLDMRSVRDAYARALSAAAHTPPSADGCTHSNSLQWFAWVADDATAPGGSVFCIGCQQCGTLLADGSEHLRQPPSEKKTRRKKTAKG